MGSRAGLNVVKNKKSRFCQEINSENPAWSQSLRDYLTKWDSGILWLARKILRCIDPLISGDSVNSGRY
jgi:hypothetical protein